MGLFKNKKTPIILQISDTECGIASLAMIFSYYKVDVSLEKLREKCGVSRDGCKAQTLINVARSYGFHADAYKIEINELQNFSLPIIAYWNFNHYIVINKINKNNVSIIDPAHGALMVSNDEFDRAFTGVVIDITPLDIKQNFKKNWEIFNLVKQYSFGFLKEIIFLLFCLIIIGAIGYLNSVLSALFTDQFIILKNKIWLNYISFLTVMLSVILVITVTIQKKSQFKLYSKASLLKLSDMLLNILNLPILFYSLRQRSEIISVLAKGENAINLIFKNLLISMLGFVTVVICVISMMNLSFSLSIVSIVLTIISSIIFYCITNMNRQAEKTNTTINGKFYSYCMTNVRNIETVKACGLESLVLSKWITLFNKNIMAQDKRDIFSILLANLNNGYNNFSMLFLLSIGSYQVISSQMSIGQLMGYYSLHLIFYNSLSHIFQAINESQTVFAANSRINDIISCDKDSRFLIKNKPQNTWNNFLNIINLNNITFYFNYNASPVLYDITINIKQGEHIALVGGTGSGKSTLAKLICGFYSANIGSLSLFGNDIKHISAEEFSRMVAYVSQDVSLFSGTILENLIFSNPGANNDEIMQAIHHACLNELVNKRKLTGIITEQGRNLSGGERQRIDIARALIQDTPILILDEATSALDYANEKKIIHNLKNLNKTIIFVAHRLSTIEHCDQIFVMKAGRIVEQGSHQDLMNKQSHYYSLVKKEINSIQLSDSIQCH